MKDFIPLILADGAALKAVIIDKNSPISFDDLVDKSQVEEKEDTIHLG